jgi:2-oxoglutarate dehydrogenase E2 component (dihydrolipoamide succinyltransferase)
MKEEKLEGMFLRTDVTDKVTLEVNAPSNGVIAELKVKEGDNVKVGDLIALMSEGGAAVTVKAAPTAQAAAPKQTQSQSESVAFLSPAPKKLAAENNVDTSKISGTGKDGRGL